MEQNAATESGEEKVESYLGQITAIDGNVISISLAEKPEAPMVKLLPVRQPDGPAPDGEKPTGEVPSGEDPDGQKPEKDMLDEMTLTLSGDTMTITVNDDTIITIDGTDATLDDLRLGDTVSFFLDGEVVTSLSVGMPEPGSLCRLRSKSKLTHSMFPRISAISSGDWGVDSFSQVSTTPTQPVMMKEQRYS